MNHAFRKSLGLLTASWLIVAGCGDDDDTSPNTGGAANTGGSGQTGGVGGTGQGGASKGGAGGTSSGGKASTGGGPSTGGAGGAGGAPTSSPECEVLGTLCHDADTGSGPAHECHEVGHLNDATECKARFGECIAVCVGGEAGAGGNGGAGGGAAGGGGAPTENPYCAALGTLCHGLQTSGLLQDCHELGHQNDGPACEAQFATCATACLDAREDEGTGGSGSGGAGSGGHNHGTAGHDHGGGGVGGGGTSGGGAGGA